MGQFSSHQERHTELLGGVSRDSRSKEVSKTLLIGGRVMGYISFHLEKHSYSLGKVKWNSGSKVLLLLKPFR